jgi:hypothetical protein
MGKVILTFTVILLIFSACKTQDSTSEINSAVQATLTSLAEGTQAEPTLPAVAQKPTDTAVPPPTRTASPTIGPTSAQTTAVTPTFPPVLTPNSTTISSKAIIIDHNSVALFDEIPDEYLAAARDLEMMWSDRSVGENLHWALDCLTATQWEKSPSSCRNDYTDSNWNWKTFTSPDGAPARILFDPDPVIYDRTNWMFEFRGGSWSELTQDFIESLAPSYLDSKAILSYQFTYLNVTEKGDIADPDVGFFADNADKYDIYDLEAFIAQHPDKIFFFWTTSLARAIGSQVATDFNNQMREYVFKNNLILFDMADIESHTDQGVPCYDNRDGVEYCSQTDQCENHPDDGIDLPAICQDYTTEPEGGHLGSVSSGAIQLAKAYWVLMARIAGWNP